MAYLVGVDLGGTKTEAVLLDSGLATISRRRVPTPSQSYAGILSSMAGLVGGITGDAKDYTVGVCTPGSLSRDGLIQNSNTRCLAGMPFLDDLERALGTEIKMENDANCFALAESRLGAAAGHGTVFGVIMGTGVGGGIIHGGRIYRGRNMLAGEWGHHTLHTGGKKCHCGKRGCVEAYLSGPALESRWAELSGSEMDTQEILQHLGTAHGRAWKAELVENFGRALANVIDILDPDIMVLGGGLSNIGFLYTEGRDSVYGHALSSIDTPILRNRLGDSAGVFGAALLGAGMEC